MKPFPIGHYAVRKGPMFGYLVREVANQTDWTVKIAEGDTWRKLDVVAVVPPEKVESIVELLEAAEGEKRRREREAKVAHQIAVSKILEGYSV